MNIIIIDYEVWIHALLVARVEYYCETLLHHKRRVKIQDWIQSVIGWIGSISNLYSLGVLPSSKLPRYRVQYGTLSS